LVAEAKTGAAEPAEVAEEGREGGTVLFGGGTERGGDDLGGEDDGDVDGRRRGTSESVSEEETAFFCFFRGGSFSFSFSFSLTFSFAFSFSFFSFCFCFISLSFCLAFSLFFS
jgi:hypothetical protein